MRFSVLNKSECAKYDSGYFLLTPDFFSEDALIHWDILNKKSSKSVSDYFSHIKDTVDEIKEVAICYDLTDALLKFFDKDVTIAEIGSTKKVAKEEDFVISKLRSYLEEMGIVEQKKFPQLFSTEFLVLRKKTEKLSTYTLFALCMTKIVQIIFKKGQHGTEHPRFYDFLLTNLPVPTCLLAMDRHIKKTIKLALKIRAYSRVRYREAQAILLSELGLRNWQPKHELTFIKNLSNTSEIDRIDAEYYQPKYDQIVEEIKNSSFGWDTLGNLCWVKKSVEVGSEEYLEEGIPFVRVSNLSPFGITEEKYISETLYQELTPKEDEIPFEESKNYQPNKGEILLSKDGTPGVAYYLKEQPKKMIPSGGILRLKSKTDIVNNEYLTLVLNSITTREQANRDAGGSIILHWRPDQVEEIVIPILSNKKQIEIQQKVSDSSNLCDQSKYLLKFSKRAVEIAIEKGEQSAINWLEEQTQNIKLPN